MATGFGQNGWIGIGEESTFGTGVSATRYLEVMEESISGKHSLISKPAIRSNSQKNRVKSKKNVEGSFKMQVPYVGMELLFKHALGSAGVVSGTNPYTRTFSLASGLPTGLTVLVNRDAANVGTGSMFRYLGCQIDKLTLTQGTEDFLMAEVSILGRDWDLQNIATPTFATFTGVDWEQLTVAEINGIQMNVEDVEITIENALASDRYILGSRVRKGLGRSGPRKVSGKFTVEFESLDEYNNYLTLDDCDLSLVWTLGSSNQLTITLPKVNLTGEDPQIKDAGPIKLPVAFEAYQNSASDDEITIVLKNTLSTNV